MSDRDREPWGWRDFVILTVTGVWAINFCAGVFITGFLPSPELNIAFMAVVGGVVVTKDLKPPGK